MLVIKWIVPLRRQSRVRASKQTLGVQREVHEKINPNVNNSILFTV